MVAPASFSFAAASTLLSVSPLSKVSSDRCPPHGWPLGGEAACTAIGGAAELEPDPLAALATP
jgi:hypothetical protein